MPIPRKLRILVVEDGDIWQDTLHKFLSDQYDLYPATSLEVALDLLDRYFFEVAFVDLRLVDADPDNEQGFQVLKQIRQLKEGTQPIVLTGWPTSERVRTAWQDYDAFDSVAKQGQGNNMEFMQNLAARAAQKAQSLHHGHIEAEVNIQTLIPSSLCTREALVAMLQVKSLEKLQWLLEQVFRELHPVKLDASTFQTHVDQGRLQAVYWSKQEGKPMFVVLGRENSIVNYSPRQVAQGGVDQPIVRKHAEYKESPLRCVVYELANADLQQFAPLPFRPPMEVY